MCATATVAGGRGLRRRVKAEYEPDAAGPPTRGGNDGREGAVSEPKQTVEWVVRGDTREAYTTTIATCTSEERAEAVAREQRAPAYAWHNVRVIRREVIETAVEEG